jgi:hypothetical protein
MIHVKVTQNLLFLFNNYRLKGLNKSMAGHLLVIHLLNLTLDCILDVNFIFLSQSQVTYSKSVAYAYLQHNDIDADEDDNLIPKLY